MAFVMVILIHCMLNLFGETLNMIYIYIYTGLILGLRTANERPFYLETSHWLDASLESALYMYAFSLISRLCDGCKSSWIPFY